MGGNGINYKAFNDSRVDPLIGTLKLARAAAPRARTPDVSGDSAAANARWLMRQRHGSSLVTACLSAAPPCKEDQWGKLNVWNCERAGWYL